MSRHFGDITQVGYVVRDIEQAMRKWIQLGVGPWFYREESPFAEYTYRGKPATPPRLSIALANSGGVQIELIQQRDNVPTVYEYILNAGLEGIQHVAYWTEDKFDEWCAIMRDQGFEEGHAGRMGAQGRFAYFISDAMPGTVIEISETKGGKGGRFKMIREAAATWDGTDPIRTLAPPPKA